MKHTPVLLNEVLQAFDGVQLKTFFDGTLGAGGHAKALLEAHPEIETYIGCDRDPAALELAEKTLSSWGKKVKLVRGSYSDLSRFLEEVGIDGIDGFLIDVGVSSMQIDTDERGFSFQREGPLDMRMDPSGPITAADVVNTYPEKKLAQIFFEYGEERKSRQVAKAIVEARRKKPFRTTLELVDVIRTVIRGRPINPATLIFQALRIEVNDELGQLEMGLSSAIEKLRPEGRLAVISFHSLEDRVVKQKIKEEEYRVPKRKSETVRGQLKIITKKPITAELKEVRANPRSRSAKLRVAEKV